VHGRPDPSQALVGQHPGQRDGHDQDRRQQGIEPAGQDEARPAPSRSPRPRAPSRGRWRRATCEAPPHQGDAGTSTSYSNASGDAVPMVSAATRRDEHARRDRDDAGPARDRRAGGWRASRLGTGRYRYGVRPRSGTPARNSGEHPVREDGVSSAGVAPAAPQCELAAG
jgi:hypothetical protein